MLEKKNIEIWNSSKVIFFVKLWQTRADDGMHIDIFIHANSKLHPTTFSVLLKISSRI